MINNEINQTATDMHNLASDTEQMGTGIGQSSPNIDLDATTGPDKPLSFKPTYETTPKEPERTHGDIMSDIQKYESEIDKLNEMQELYRNGNFIAGNKLAKLLNINIEKYFNEQDIKEMFPDGKLEWGKYASLYDPRKSELLNSIKELKAHEQFDNRTDAEKRIDQLLKDERDREDTAAQRGTIDMLKAGLHPASANYGGSVGGSSGGGGGGSSGSSESEKEKERRRRRKKLLEERKREREKEKRQNVITLLSRMGSAATYGGMRAAAFRPKNMNNPTIKKNNEPEWLNEYLKEIKNMKG